MESALISTNDSASARMYNAGTVTGRHCSRQNKLDQRTLGLRRCKKFNALPTVVIYYTVDALPHSSPEVPAQFPILCMHLMRSNGLPPVGQLPADICYDCFHACMAAVMIKVGLQLESVVWLWLALGLVLQLGLVSGLGL